MNSADIIRHYKAGFIIWGLAALTQVGPARASLLGFQAQTEYDFTQSKQRGFKSSGRGRFSTNYTLTLRRPFLPTSTLMSDLSFNSTQNGDYNSTQRTEGWALNLYATQTKYMLSSRISRSKYGLTSGTFDSSTGSNTDYNVSMFLRQPAWPVVNLQYQRNVSDTNFAGTTGSYATSTWIMSSSYDKAPLRFSLDRIRQNYGYSGAPGIQMNNQSAAVMLNHTLLPGLTLTGELRKTNTDVAYEASDTSTKTLRRALRLSATPLRSVVADVSYISQAVNQNVGLFTGTSDDKSLTYSVRSEILPGLSLDWEDQKQTLSGSAYLSTRGSKSRNRSLSMAARLTEGTVLTVTNTNYNYNVPSFDYHANQKSLQSSLQTALTRTTDLSLNYGRSKSSTGIGDLYDNKFSGITLRDRTSSRLSLGATYRHNNITTLVPGGAPYHQNGDEQEVDMLFQPNYNLGIDLRMSHQNAKGSGAYRAFSPSANVRWQLNTNTNLTANYSLQRYRTLDPVSAFLYGQETRGLTMRLTHSFTNGAYLDVAYDFAASNFGDFEWHRQLRVSFTMNP